MAIIRASSHYDSRGQCHVNETAHDTGRVEITFTRAQAAEPFAAVVRPDARSRWRLQCEGLPERQFKTKQNAITAALDHAALLTMPRVVVIGHGMLRVYSDRANLQICVIDLSLAGPMPDLWHSASYGPPTGSLDAAATVIKARGES